jgi:hypothetical protein
VTVETGEQVNIRSELGVTVETGGQVNIRSEMGVTVDSSVCIYNLFVYTHF